MLSQSRDLASVHQNPENAGMMAYVQNLSLKAIHAHPHCGVELNSRRKPSFNFLRSPGRCQTQSCFAPMTEADRKRWRSRRTKHSLANIGAFTSTSCVKIWKYDADGTWGEIDNIERVSNGLGLPGRNGFSGSQVDALLMRRRRQPCICKLHQTSRTLMYRRRRKMNIKRDVRAPSPLDICCCFCLLTRTRHE